MALSIPASTQCLVGSNACLSFDGNDRVTIVSAPLLSGPFADFTIETWYKATAPGTQQYLLSNWDWLTGQGGFRLRVEASGSLTFEAACPPLPGIPNCYWSIQNPPLAGNSGWHHVAVTRNGSDTRMYVDGEYAYVGQSGSSTHTFPVGYSARDLSLGCHVQLLPCPQLCAPNFHGPVQFFTGMLDEVRVWNVGRSHGQIAGERFSVLNGNEPGLVGYWRLNDGAGQIVLNSASATAGLMDGMLGAWTTAFSDDPTWVAPSTAPISYCAVATGQPNTPGATLNVNGVGYGPAGGVSGPFAVSIPRSGPEANTLTLTWHGPGSAPLLLLTGLPQSGAIVAPCVGSLDLDPASLAIAGGWNYTPPPLNSMFRLNYLGFAETTFSVPLSLSYPVGSGPHWWFSLQGAVASGCSPIPYTLTSQFTISF